jgi:hypothetical protein
VVVVVVVFAAAQVCVAAQKGAGVGN